MIYYKVVASDYVDISVNTENDYTLVPGEIYTPREIENLNFPERIKEKYLEPVEVKKSEIYWFFGARFYE